MKKNQLLAIFSLFFIIILSSSLISVLSTNNNNIILKNKSEKNVSKIASTKGLTTGEIQNQNKAIPLYNSDSEILNWRIDLANSIKTTNWRTNNISFISSDKKDTVTWYAAMVLGCDMTTYEKYLSGWNNSKPVTSSYANQWIINPLNFTIISEYEPVSNYEDGYLTFKIAPTQKYIDSNEKLNFTLNSKPLILKTETTLFIKMYNFVTPYGFSTGGYIGLGVGIGLVSIIFGGIMIRTLVHKKRIYFSKNKATKEIDEIEEVVKISEKDESKKIHKSEDKLDKK